jgi:RecB family endonuclease NucS
VDQQLRYLELLDRDPLLAPVRGVFAAPEMRPQARVPAENRGVRCVRWTMNQRAASTMARCDYCDWLPDSSSTEFPDAK